MNPLCPYCRKHKANSKEHIFLKFFGGVTYIRACATCNNKFGSEFEGVISKQLTPLIVSLMISGMPFPTNLKWRGAFIHPDNGLSFDLSDKLKFTLSHVKVTKDDQGRVIHYQASNLETIKLLKKQQLSKKLIPKEFVIKESTERIKAPTLISNYSLDENFFRFILKMCVSFCRYMQIDEFVIEDSLLLYLLKEKDNYHEVRRDLNYYPVFDDLVPPLSHVIYVEASPKQGRAYAIVRLFGGLFQFSTTLFQNYSGAPFSGIGIFNPIDYSEDFKIIEPLDIQQPSQRLFRFIAIYFERNILKRTDKQVYELFGEKRVKFYTSDYREILSQICICCDGSYYHSYTPGYLIIINLNIPLITISNIFHY
ncbi:HNH endonuclease [Nitrosomonas ureae]|uniref:HNH endonuclease n=1 Tax=Nitrosomonas ureae TaxID=44577 RepID=A0A1H2HPU0_9PROT|nr:HNH endonuclease [Nitrosomonas ureae]ALQ52070.1 hypothetical protein ATY38_13105 [Nitrosomonas ureae]SDU33832.1 HNH endonuclease [Nitrosomonas ureae]